MPRRFDASGGAGYDAVQASTTSRSLPVSRAARTAASISPMVAVPVEMIVGSPVAAIDRISGRSVISLEADLIIGTPRPCRKSTAVGSKGALKPSIPSSWASAKIGSCQSHGVCASV